MTDLKQQVVKGLADSGLFDKLAKGFCPECGIDGAEWFKNGEKCQESYFSDSHYCEFEKRPPEIWPTADQAEAIICERGLQVVWLRRRGTYIGWYISDDLGTPIKFRGEEVRLPGVSRGQRTLANNAALAWLANQPDWKPKLKADLMRWARGKGWVW